MSAAGLMQSRVEQGLDPLTGNPLQIVGAVRICSDGVLRDEAGFVCDLTADGDWRRIECLDCGVKLDDEDHLRCRECEDPEAQS